MHKKLSLIIIVFCVFIFTAHNLKAVAAKNSSDFNECSVENLKRISGKNFEFYKNSIQKIIKICEIAKSKKLTLVNLISLPPHDSVGVSFAELDSLKKEGDYVYVNTVSHQEYFNAESAKYVMGTGMTSTVKYNCVNFDEPFFYIKASSHKTIFDKSNIMVYSQDTLNQMAKYTKKIQTKAERIVSSNFYCRLGNQLNRTSTLMEYYVDQKLLKSSGSDLNYSFWKEELKRMGYSEDGKSRINTIEDNYNKKKKTIATKQSSEKQTKQESFSTTIERTNDNASKYYKTLNKSLGDPQMQLAILKLNQAQYYFLTALGEKETALAAKNYAENLTKGNALGKDDLQKILVQTKEQQKIINKKMNDGMILNQESKIIFSNGFPSYIEGVKILVQQGFDSYSLVNFITSDSGNIFGKIISGFSLFLKVKDSITAIPLFFSSTGDIFEYASLNEIKDIDELSEAKDSLGV